MIMSGGDSLSPDQSSLVDLNAAALARSGSTITLADSSVTTSGLDALGFFTTGSSSTAVLAREALTTTGDNAHAVTAVNGGALRYSAPTTRSSTSTIRSELSRCARCS